MIQESIQELSNKICRLLKPLDNGTSVHLIVKDGELEGHINLHGFTLFTLLVQKAMIPYLCEFGDSLKGIPDLNFSLKYEKVDDKIVIINSLDIDKTLDQIINQ